MKYISRKFILCLLVMAQASLFLAMGFIDASTWAALVGGALTVYTTGNVAQKATSKPDAP